MAWILVDMDDTIADLDGRFLEIWRRRWPKLPYVPLDQRKTYYIEDQFPIRYHRLIRDIIYAPGLFLGLPPIPGAFDAIREMAALGHEVRFCSTPILENGTCAAEKFQWLETHLDRDWAGKLVLTHDKTLVRGDYLIDDKPVITGKMRPSWEQVYFDRPYNRHIGGRRRIVDWSDWRRVLGL